MTVGLGQAFGDDLCTVVINVSHQLLSSGTAAKLSP